MSRNIIARVIMLPNGSVHIAVLSGNTYEGTPRSLTDLLSDPYEFLEAGYSSYRQTVGEANQSHFSLSNIKGLTLIKIYDDAEIVCIFPKLLNIVFKQFGEDSDSPINLIDVLEEVELSDEKHFLMKFFCDFTNKSSIAQSVRRRLNISYDQQTEILLETINTAFSEYPDSEPGPLSKEQPNVSKQMLSFIKTDDKTKDDLRLNYLTVDEFANKCNVSPNTVSSWYQKKKLDGAIKMNNKVYIPRNTPYPLDGRAGRNMPPKSKLIFKSKILSYKEVQEYIEEKSKISYPIRKYIRCVEEMLYYTKNNYREAVWNDRPVLIIDINPEYRSKRLGKTNRELILDGKSPVVPIPSEPEYDVHHIGQKFDSPFAIVPHTDHSKLNTIFHMGSTNEWNISSDEDLHGQKFQVDKFNFWLKYLEEYDKSGGYPRIDAQCVRLRGNKK